jgi:hypothetical protein
LPIIGDDEDETQRIVDVPASSPNDETVPLLTQETVPLDDKT